MRPGRFKQVRAKVDLRAQKDDDEEHHHKLHFGLYQMHVLSKKELR
jgi:hypothetical protein